MVDGDGVYLSRSRFNKHNQDDRVAFAGTYLCKAKATPLAQFDYRD